MSWQWKTMQNLERNWLVGSKLTWRIWRILTRAQKILKICTLVGCFWPNYIIFELKKVQRSYIWRHWRLMQNLKENLLVLSKMTWRIWQIFVHKLKNSDFILESKKSELNQNKNSKQPDQLDQQDSLLLMCPGIYSQIYHRTPCPTVLICKGV